MFEDLKVNIYRNKRGMVVVNGRVQPITPGATPPGTDDTPDVNVPNLDRDVREIFLEVEALRLTGKLQPFREGEPIGVLPRRVRPRVPTPALWRKAHNQRMEQRRKDMLQLRARNDATLAALIGKRF